MKYYFYILLFLFTSISWAQSGSANVPFLANFNNYPVAGYNDCWGYTAPDGREYALLGVTDGTSIIDITDPNSINEIAFIPSPQSTWKDIKTYLHYAYVVNEASGGMQIIDLSNLPNSASLAGTYTGFSASHNIYIDENRGILYAEGNVSEPVRVISLSDPLNPVQVSFLGVECHDVFAFNSILYVSEGSNGSIGIFNIDNPINPGLINRFFIPSAGYVHNAWTSDDGNLLMTTEETSTKTIKLWDVSDPNNVIFTDEILGPDGLAHNTHIKGNYAYVSHYGDGLRIYDISDPYNIFEAGYYDTYPAPAGGFEGAWGAFPFYSSGKILISDRSTGLYVVYFEGAVEADDLDPKSPTNISAYSDFSSPSTMNLNWTDPSELIDGTTISSSDFTIEIFRNDSIFISSVPGGSEAYSDNGLIDGEEYQYTFIAKLTANDSTSIPRKVSWTAGGSPVPSPPNGVFIVGDQNPYMLKWQNPNTNIDGTPLDDLGGLYLYQDGVLTATFNRTSADSGQNDSASITIPAGIHDYYLTAFDNENPVNESDPSNSTFKPISLPLFDDFPASPTPNVSYWRNTNAEVNNIGLNPPSPPYVLSLDGHPNGGDVIELFPVNLIGLETSQVTISYWYQPQGNGNAPELGDELYCDFLNDLGQWVNVRTYPGSGLTNFVQESIDVANENAGVGATFYHASFQFRFRNTGTASTTSNFDHWLIDDVQMDVIISSVGNDSKLPQRFSLSPNFPNPFNPQTTIKYELPVTGNVKLVVYNLLGQEVRTLIDEQITAGKHQIVWNGTNNAGSRVASGVYVYKFIFDSDNASSSDQNKRYLETRKMILLK